MKRIIIITTLFCSIQLCAQQPLLNLARPGAKGIFVLTGEKISDVQGPVTAYRIERKAGDEKDFTLVATLPAVVSVTDFKANAVKSFGWLPFVQERFPLKLDSIWKQGKAAGKLAALRTASYSLPVLAGFNMIWLDSTVTSGKTYQYRVTAVGEAYTAISSPVLFASPVMSSLQFQKGVFNGPQHYMQLNWMAAGKNKPAHIEVYRRENNSRFVKVPADVSFYPKKDTFEYVIKDTTARRDQLYNYYLKAYDALGNASPVSDTILIASLDYMQMPMPQQVKAISDSVLHAIHISWQLRSAALIKSLTLYRSTSSVKGFEPIAVLSSRDTVFADQQVQPATPYFYYFEAEYKTQDRPKRSTSFAGSFIDNTRPNVPQNIQATGTKQGVQLTWQYPAPHVSGFWLYRAERGQPLQLLTTMIAATPSQADYTYTDTDTLLNGSRFYTYALKAFSTSHIESANSDTVVARPLKNIPVPKPPMQINTTKEAGLVLVYWDAVSKYDETVSGYKLLRSRNNTTDTIYCINNLYKDSLVKAGETIRYSVITRSMFDVQSVPAAWVAVTMPVIKPGSPAALAANPVKTGIQLTWELPNAGETLQYNVYRFERGQQAVKTGSTSGQEKFIDTSVVRGKQYFYYVIAVGEHKIESDRSNEAVVKY